MTKKLVLFFVLGLAIASAQSAPSFTTAAGTLAPTTRPCNDFSNAGSLYTQYQDPANGFSGLYVCTQIGAASLGQGAYGWLAVQPAGSSPTTGTISVANGKAAVISNSLTFAGTDGTTLTGPSTSGTLVTLAATQTLTNKTLTTPTLTAPVVSTLTNTGTVTLPTNTGGVPVAYFCGATTGATTCANTSGGATARVIGGLATLASNSAVISSISPAFTSTTTFSCSSNDSTTVGNPTKVVNTSSSSITITNTTGASDLVSWVCVGY